MNNFKIDIDKLIELNLSFEEYFVLYCIHTNNKKLITSYTNNCKKIKTYVFIDLESNGLINIKDRLDNNIYFELLSLTDKGKSLLSNRNPLKSEDSFEEFRKFYPSIVRQGLETRRLHGNLKKCKSAYEKLLLETTHEILCKCATLYHREKIRSNSVIYMQNLETWLNQANYKQYLQDLEKEIVITNTENTQSEDI
mgnify:CR=1 FL=1